MNKLLIHVTRRINLKIVTVNEKCYSPHSPESISHKILENACYCLWTVGNGFRKNWEERVLKESLVSLLDTFIVLFVVTVSQVCTHAGWNMVHWQADGSLRTTKLIQLSSGVNPEHEQGDSTFSAFIRPFSSVNFLVLNQFKRCHQRSTKTVTTMRPFSSVNFLVPNQMGTPAVGFPTLAAHIRLFSSVNPLVQDEAGVAAKEFPTFTALVRPCSCVYFLVLNKVGAANVGFSTLIAHVRPRSSVNPLV